MHFNCFSPTHSHNQDKDIKKFIMVLSMLGSNKNCHNPYTTSLFKGIKKFNIIKKKLY
jgi:hypothetical protein